jgi:hypothetical protein
MLQPIELTLEVTVLGVALWLVNREQRKRWAEEVLVDALVQVA